MTTGRINQGASCVRSLAWSDTRPLSVDERAAPALAHGESPFVCRYCRRSRKPVGDTPCV